MTIPVPVQTSVVGTTIGSEPEVSPKPSMGTLAGRFVESWFASLHPGYCCSREEREVRAGVEPVSFSPDPVRLAERLIASVCPEYRFITTVFPDSARLPSWLCSSARGALAARWEAVSSSRLTGKVLAAAEAVFCASLLSWLPRASAETIRVGSARELNNMPRDWDGKVELIADIDGSDLRTINYFGGTFDGKYHTIYNVKTIPFFSVKGIISNVSFKFSNATRPEFVNKALVSEFTKGGVIQNVRLEDGIIYGYYNVAIVSSGGGYNWGMTNVTVARCHAVATGDGSDAALGVVHTHEHGMSGINFENCTVSAWGKNSRVAGLIDRFGHGHQYSNVTITDCIIEANGEGSAAGMLAAETRHNPWPGANSGTLPPLNETLAMGDHVIIKGGRVSANGTGSSAGLITGRIQKGLSVSLNNLRADCVNISATGRKSSAGILYGATFSDSWRNSKDAPPSFTDNGMVACNIRVNGVVNDDYCPDSNGSCPVRAVPTPWSGTGWTTPSAKTPTKIPTKIPTTRTPSKLSQGEDLFQSPYFLPIVCVLLGVSVILLRLCCLYLDKRRGREIFRSFFRRSATESGQYSRAGVRYTPAAREADSRCPEIQINDPPPPYTPRQGVDARDTEAPPSHEAPPSYEAPPSHEAPPSYDVAMQIAGVVDDQPDGQPYDQPPPYSQAVWSVSYQSNNRSPVITIPGLIPEDEPAAITELHEEDNLVGL